MRKIQRIIGVLFVTLFMVLPTISPVCAIDDPDSVTLPAGAVFRDVLSSGDQLWFVRYNINYGSTPTEDADQTWLMAIYDTDGTTLLYTRAVNYYQENIISIYLTSAQALTWQDTYYIRIMGNPGLFPILTEGTNMITKVLTPGDYYEQTSFQGYLLTQANILQTDWAITLLTSGDKLNVTGATFFKEAIPGLNNMLPDFFQVNTATMTTDNTSYTNAYADNTSARKGGMNVAFMEIGSMFGVSEGWTMLWGVGILDVILMGIIYGTTKRPEIAFVSGFFLTAIMGWVGLIQLQIVIILLIFVAILFAILFILGRFA